MDGNLSDYETFDKEAQRRKRVYEEGMARIKAEETRKAARGYAVMAAVDSMEPASRGVGTMGKMVTWSKFICLLFVGIAPNYLVWKLLL
ncbi:MAG: hypothetical protein AB3N11_18080 [Arenibacterium sp.]